MLIEGCQQLAYLIIDRNNGSGQRTPLAFCLSSHQRLGHFDTG